MPVVLICAPTPLEGELSDTLLWRQDIERHQTGRYEAALALAVAAQPRLTLIDRRMPRAVELVQSLRNDPQTRRSSLVVMAPGDFEPGELDLIEAGANAILRLPADRQWDARLDQLLSIPARREARFSVDFSVEAMIEGSARSGTAMNLSARGMLLQARSALEVGDWITLSFRLPGSFVDGEGRVVRQAGAAQYGVLFHNLARDGRQQIEHYIASLPPGPST